MVDMQLWFPGPSVFHIADILHNRPVNSHKPTVYSQNISYDLSKNHCAPPKSRNTRVIVLSREEYFRKLPRENYSQFGL